MTESERLDASDSGDVSAIILVFLKYPRPGEVKTRLGTVLGFEKAAALYRTWIRSVFEQIQPVRCRIRVIGCYTGGVREEFHEWWALADSWWDQGDGDLGARLARLFDQAATMQVPVVAIGTDCLEIDASIIEQAIRKLKANDVVFGPTHDGGYYLVGTARSLPGLFEGIPWSSPLTLAVSLARCEAHQWSFQLLPEMADIDTIDDLPADPLT